MLRALLWLIAIPLNYMLMVKLVDMGMQAKMWHEATPSIQLFTTLTGKESNVYFTFEDIPQEYVRGQCHIFERRIVIDRPSWETMDKFMREQLVLHELGHCVMFYHHGDGIMRTTLLPTEIYQKYRKELLLHFSGPENFRKIGEN